MTTELDRLIFTLDADLAPYKAKLAQVEALAAATGKRVSQNVSPFFSDSATGAASLMKMRSAVDNYTAGLKDADTATKGLHGSTATATREFRALFDELSGGRTRMIPGTLAIIATRVFGIGGAALAAGAAILGIPAAAVIAAERSIASFKAIETQIRATGNAVGLTIDQANEAAKGISAATGISSNQARNLIASASSNPRVGGGVALGLAGMAPDFARATGQTPEESTKKLVQLFADPAKGAKELADSMNLLSAGQLRQIENLAAQGEKEKAQILLLDAVNVRLAGMDKEAEGLFGRISDAISRGWSNLGGNLNGITTPSDRVRTINQTLSGSGPFTGGMFPPRGTSEEERAGLTMERDFIGAAESADRQKAAMDRQIATQRQLIDQGVDIAKSFDLVDDKTRTYTNDVDLLTKALSAAESQLAKAKGAMASGNGTDKDAADAATLPDIIKSLQAARIASGLASANQMSPFQRAAGPLNAEMLGTGMPAAQRELFLGQSRIGDQYLSDLSNHQMAGNAGALKALRLGAFSASRANEFSDPFGQFGALGVAQNANSQGQSMMIASGISPAAMAQSSRASEAYNATSGLRSRAATPDEIAQVDALTKALQEEYEQRDKINQAIKANDEDRQLQQTLDEKRLELSLMKEDAGERATEIADLQTRNQLINEGYQVGTQAFDDELQKRKQITDEIAKTNTLIEQGKKDNEQWQKTISTVTDQIGSSFERAVASGKSEHQIVQMLEQDFAALITKLAVFNPLSNSLTGLATGTSGNAPTLGGLIDGLFGNGSGGGVDLGSFIDNMFYTGSGSGASAGDALDISAFAPFAAGGPISGPAIVGEQGPEIFNPGVPGTITPADQTRRLLGGASQAVSITQVISISPDVSAIAKKQVLDMMPIIRTSAAQGVQAAMNRGSIRVPGAGR